MRIVFISNYFNHHQRALSDAFYRLTEGQYRFIATVPMEEERLQMGWQVETFPPYVVNAYGEEERKNLLPAVTDADAVIIGSAEESWVKERIRKGKPVFRYSERIMKGGYEYWKIPVRCVKSFFRNRGYRHVYLLCASAYAAGDYARLLSFIGHTYKWGYFPETKRYDIAALMKKKEKEPVLSVLWAGRMIGWKHPEKAVRAAEYLKQCGYPFYLKMIGDGELRPELEKMTAEKGLSDCVSFTGSLKPEAVRESMEKADIYLFTSDFNEGWGAVLNESMNSGCAVLASDAIGAVPFLLKNGENGFVYRDGDEEQFLSAVGKLARDRSLCRTLGENAYRTVTVQWNADIAAEHFLALFHALSEGKQTPYAEGICSTASARRSRKP